MRSARSLWLAIAVTVAALVVFDVVVPALGRVVPGSRVAGSAVVVLVVLYLVGTIVAANARRLRFRIPAPFRRPRLRAVPRSDNAAAKFIEEFQRGKRR